MAKIRGQGFNKEKLIFLVSAMTLVVVAYRYFDSAPWILVVGKPLTQKPPPTDAALADYRLKQDIDHYLQGKRKSPFTPDRFWQTQTQPTIAQDPPNKTNNKESGNLIPSPPPQEIPSEKPEKEAQKEALRPTEKDLQVAFMGIVIMDGSSYALLARKDGSPPHRVKLGETIEELNYTITKIEKQAIYLEDGDGNPYVLKDTHFGSADDGGESAEKGGKPRKSTSDLPDSKKNEPKPKPKKQPDKDKVAKPQIPVPNPMDSKGPEPNKNPKAAPVPKGNSANDRINRILERQKSKKGNAQNTH